VKKLVRLVMVLVVLVIAAVVAAVLYIDAIAKRAVETSATAALGVDTTLRQADVGILAGRFDMSDLKVSNPHGFDTAHFLTLHDGGVNVSFNSLLEDTVVLPELNLTGIDVNLEKKDGKANYDVILANLKRREGGDTPPGEPQPGGKRFIIKRIAVRDVMIHANFLPIGGDVTRTDLPVKEIILTDVGSDSVGGVGGATIDDIVNHIVQAVFSAAVKEGGGLIPTDIAGDLAGGLAQLGNLGKVGVEIGGKAIEGLGQAAGDITKKAAEGVGEVGKGIEKGVGDALKGLGGLIGENKDAP
jgi:hypothetical protein